MIDKYGRTIDYARFSITDRCNLRCVYCMPASGVVGYHNVLSDNEWIRIAHILADLGIQKIKITGGEPLARASVPELIASLKSIPGIAHVSLTTNGTLLSGVAEKLSASGLDGINISLDTMDDARYQVITRTDRFSDAIQGIESAIAAGIPSIKLNAVPLMGIDKADIIGLAAYAKHHPIHVRFIELMPIGSGKMLRGEPPLNIRTILTQAYGTMTSYTKTLGNGPAVYENIAGFQGKIGFISALSDCFCQTCNRIRITADGVLKTCLHMDQGISLIEETSDTLTRRIRRAIWHKPVGHAFLPGEESPGLARIMAQIGG